MRTIGDIAQFVTSKNAAAQIARGRVTPLDVSDPLAPFPVELIDL